MNHGNPRKHRANGDEDNAIRCLERGLNILRAFRPGTSVRGNSEIAELTGLPRATVSRLTNTLVACRFLEHDRVANAYRLSSSVLSLAEAWLASSELLPIATPLMNETSEALDVNVSLARPDLHEIVYLYSVRRSHLGPQRRVTTGHCIPMESTSLGHAYLATLDRPHREQVLSYFQRKAPDRDWKALRSLVSQSIAQIRKAGYCRVDWLPGIAVFATAVEVHGAPPYLISIGTSVQACSDQRVQAELVPALMELRKDIASAIDEINRHMKNQKTRRATARPDSDPFHSTVVV